MARLDIKDIPDQLMEALDEQRKELEIGSRSDYIKFLISLDIMHKITIQVKKNENAEKQLLEAQRKVEHLQQHQGASLENLGQLQEDLRRARRSAASYQDENFKLKKELEEFKAKIEKYNR